MRSKLLLLFVGGVTIASATFVVYEKWDAQQHRITSTSFGRVDWPGSDLPALIREFSSESPALSRPPLDKFDAWRNWQTALRQVVADDVYELFLHANTTAPKVLVHDRQTIGNGLTRVELWIPADKGHRVPAVLLLPDKIGPVPGILVIPGHVKDGASGLQQMTSPIRSYHNAAALRLAEAGFATLTIELRGFGVLGPPEYPNHQIVAYNALLAGHFYKKLAIQDIRYAFEYLVSRDEIDSSRIGMTGVSLGGELTVAYAGLDDRVKAVAFHSYGGAVGRFPGITASKVERPHYCHIVPGSNSLYFQEDPILLLAPRPTLATRGIERPFSQPAFFDVLTKTWAAFGLAENIVIANLEGQAAHRGHAYFVNESVQFFSDNL